MMLVKVSCIGTNLLRTVCTSTKSVFSGYSATKVECKKHTKSLLEDRTKPAIARRILAPPSQIVRFKAHNLK